MILTLVLAGLTLLSLVLSLWQWKLAFHFPLHERGQTPLIPPALTILKPLKGVDAKSSECLASWLGQAYGGPVQVLFGVANAEDPVCELARQSIAAHPKAEAQLVVCPKMLGANAKVSTLIQLMPHARHDIILVSDADVWVPSDFLAQVVHPLEQAGVGLTTCFYQMTATENSAMSWEAFAINADFWSQVLQSKALRPLDFALGAVMAMRRTGLEKIGGFNSLADYLADDYQLGHLIAGSGARIALCPVVAECRNGLMTWRQVWAHQLRWARTIRVCQPLPYFFSQVHNATLWPLLLVLFKPGRAAFLVAGSCFLIRVASAFYCERKLTRSANWNVLWLAPLKDLLQLILWMLAFFGNRVHWRGQWFRILRGGKLVKC